MIHIPHIGHVPFVERLVEGGCLAKHERHRTPRRTLRLQRQPQQLPERNPTSDEQPLDGLAHVRVRDVRQKCPVPLTDLAVFFHNTLLPSSADYIIANGASYGCVRQFWREERMHLANFPKHVSIRNLLQPTAQ